MVSSCMTKAHKQVGCTKDDSLNVLAAVRDRTKDGNKHDPNEVKKPTSRGRGVCVSWPSGLLCGRSGRLTGQVRRSLARNGQF